MTQSIPNIDELLARAGTRSLNSALFNIAHSYARAGEMAASAIFTANDADFAAPALMCKSFAIELLLKFFLVVPHPTAQTKADIEAAGVNLHGHEYSKLYDRINPSYQQRIAASYSTVSGKTTDAAAFRSVLLALGNDPFVFWRYIYEKAGVHTIDIPLLEQVLFAMGKAAEAERKLLVSTAP